MKTIEDVLTYLVNQQCMLEKSRSTALARQRWHAAIEAETKIEFIEQLRKAIVYQHESATPNPAS